MKKILFVLENYRDFLSQNANCVRSIVKEMNGCEPFFLSVEYSNCEKHFDNEHVFCVTSKSRRNKLCNLFRKINKFFFMPIENKRVVSKLIKAISALDLKHHFDLIIAVQNPCESTEAVAGYKKRNLKSCCCLYEIDPASNRYKNPHGLFQKMWARRTQRWELKRYVLFDYVIHMKTHARHFSNKVYLQFSKKTFFLDIPSFVVRNLFPSSKKNIELVLIYSGAFYPGLREPNYMLRVLNKVYKMCSFRLDLFSGKTLSMQNCRKIVTNCDNLYLHDFIEESQLVSKVESANFLISVGNIDSDYLPSKIFFYMGFGKPIIHFAKDDSDVVVSYLNKYENSLIVFENDSFDDNCRRVISFLQQSHSCLNLVDLYEKFFENTPKCSALFFEELLKRSDCEKTN